MQAPDHFVLPAAAAASAHAEATQEIPTGQYRVSSEGGV